MPVNRYKYTPAVPVIESVLFDGNNYADVEELTQTTDYIVNYDYNGAGANLITFTDYSLPNLYQDFYLVKATYPNRVQWYIVDAVEFEMDYSLDA